MVSAAPPAKILDYKRDLSSLRYRGQWQTVIQLAEKYLGKLGENRSADYAFGLICKGEGLLNQIHQDYLRRDFPADDGVRRRHWYPVDFPQPTAPDPSPDDSIVIEDMDDERQSTTGSNLSPEEHERSAVALKYLTQAVAILQGEDSYSRQLFLEASTILCFHDGIIGQTEQMANRIRDPRWQWNLDNPPPDLADSAHPYEHVLRLMFWTAHALGSQAEKEEDTSLLYINRAVEYYRQHKVLVCPKLSRTRPTHGSDEDQWLRWAEFSHFWSTLHNARLGNSEQSIAVARDYVKMMGSSSNDHRTQPRIAVVGTLMRQLAGVPIVGEIPVPFRGIATQSPPTLAPEIRKELLRLAVTYEALTTHLLDFPRGEDQLPMEKNRHARVVECYDWYVWLMTQPVPGENVGQACDRYIDLLKHLYRGTKHTFHNMRLFRYLCHTLTRLMLLNHDNMSLGERIEAEAVMESYKFFWIKHFDSKLASEKKKKAESVGSIPSSPRRLSTVRSMKRRDANGNTITMDVPYDPVFDKDGNYIRLKDLDAYLEKLTKEEDDKIMKALQMTTIPDDNLVVIGEVDGERIEDAIGVFLSAVKVFTLTADGEVAKLEVAYDYAKLALGLIEEHGRALLNPTTYRFEAYKITAEVCLELEQEVREVGARTQWQVRAADAIRKCLVEQPKSPEVLYLKALLAAQRGECESATLIVRASLHENKDRATSWNLMALLCSAHKEYDQAIQFCRAGAIKSYEYLEQLLAAGDVSDAHIDAEKFDLINLKLTDASLRLQKEGPEGGLEVIREVITLARKLFPGVDGGRSTDEIIAGPSRSTTPTPSIATGRTGSSIGASPYIAPYRFGIHDLFVGIWLATSSLYRLAGMLDKAKNAVQEAETLAEEVIRMDSLIEGTPSRFYSGISMDKLLERQSGIQRDMRLGKIKTAMRVGESDKFDSFPTWGPARARVRRVIADVAFEAALVRQCELTALKRTPTEPRFKQYLSPTEQVNQEKLLRTWSTAVELGGLKPSLSQISISSANTTGSLVTTASTPLGRELMRASSPSSNSATPPPPRSGSLRGLPNGFRPSSDAGTPPPPVQLQVNGVSVRNGTPSPLPPQEEDHVLSEDDEDADPSRIKQLDPNDPSTLQPHPLTLETLVQDFESITFIDDDHLGARVELGKLYMEQDRWELAESFFERACKNSRARGGGGGRPSWYGGATAKWGWESWRYLAKCLAKDARSERAYEAMAMAVRVRRGLGFVHGLETLRRSNWS